ncbi:hypothetical protein F511_34871 [Dorcoceras hygrometricum]|uniref:Uncharacterized protein n=1 Tax=Dorcoceras hygrometricum TaxID=472368 RepID=A0A2Z7B8B7_9LAMI|nr:hypothetical protein F511_34871 [Dorcoceras hygrometricum]
METEEMFVEPEVSEGIATGTDLEEPMEPRSEDITEEISEESMSIEDLLLQIPGNAMLPSALAAEPTKIKVGFQIQIPGVTEKDQYRASLPQIATTDKGKEPLMVDTIQGHPAREIFSLICANIEFFIQLREQVIEAVSNFFNSFSIRRLSALGSLEEIAAKEEKVLNWGETDSVQIDLQRRVYIVAKYRELLLPKFLEARRHNFVSGTPTTAIDLKVLELLTAAHHFSLKVLLRKVKEHKLEWTRPTNSLFLKDTTLIAVTSFQQIIGLSSLPAGLDFSVQISPVLDITSVPTDSVLLSPSNLDFSFSSPHQSSSSASSMHFTDDILQDLRKEVKDLKAELSKDFDDKMAVIRNDLLEFRVETQGQLASLGTNLAELIAFITKGRDDKKGEVSSSMAEVSLLLEMVAVVVAGVSHQEKEVVVDLGRKVGDTG